MTSRAFLQKRVLLSNICLWLGFVLLGVGIHFQKSTQNEWWYAPIFIGFCLFAGALHYAYYYAIKCPSCGKSFYLLIMRMGLWLSDSIQVCPSCSLKLDEEWTGDHAAIPSVAAIHKADSAIVPNGVIDARRESSIGNNRMTGRELINGQASKTNRILWAGFVMMLAGIIVLLMTENIAWVLLFIASIPIYWYAQYFTYSVCRCPWCHCSLMNASLYSSGWLPDEVQVCHQCARRLDDPVEDQNATTHQLPSYPE